MGSGIRQRRFFRGLELIIVLTIIFVSNYFLQIIGVSTSFTRNYLDDLLALPIILWLTRTFLRIIYPNQRYHELSFSMLCATFLMVSILFEWLLPKYYEHLTADIFDVFCYAFGVLFYQLFIMNADESSFQ